MGEPELDVLDYYGDGTRYDAENLGIRHDIAYYEGVAAEAKGPILELACGTGRLTIPMARAGASVVGIDNAAAMIERAEAKRAELPKNVQHRLSFEAGDMRTVRLGRTFDAVVLGFNTLMHMTEDCDLAAALETARVHLAPGGRFHIDLHTPLPDIARNRPDDERFDPQEMIDPRTGDRFIVSENNAYDARRQVNRMRFYYRRVDRSGTPIGVERVAIVDLRVLFPRELDRWIDLAGFDVVGDWENFDRKEPFRASGGRRVMALKARRSRDKIR